MEQHIVIVSQLFLTSRIFREIVISHFHSSVKKNITVIIEVSTTYAGVCLINTIVYTSGFYRFTILENTL